MSEPTISPAAGVGCGAATAARHDERRADRRLARHRRCHRLIKAGLGERAVIGDDGREIRLMLYSQSSAIGAVTLAPCRAIALAGDLIAAALPKLRAP